MKKRNVLTIGNFIMALLIIIFCAVCITPIIPQGYIRIVQMVTTATLFLYMLVSLNQSNDIHKIGLGLMGYYVLILGYWGIGYSDASIGNYFFQISFFITIIAAYYCLNNLSSKYNILIYYVLLLLISIHYLGDIVVGQRFQDYSMRELKEVGSNVIATSFSSLSLVVFCFSLVVLLNTQHKTTKYIHLAIVALNFYYIVFCGQRGSVVVLMLLALSLILYERFFHKNNTKRSTYIGFMVVASLLFFLFGDSIISLMIQLSPSDRLTARFQDLQGTMINGVNTESFSGRLTLSLLSIKTWLSNIMTFLFGIGDHRLEGDWGMMGFYMSGIGGHSELIDSLARYGIIGFSIIAYLYYHICNYILKQFKIVQIKNQIRAIIIASVFVALTKGLFFPEIGIGLFLLLPLSSELLNE